MKRLPALVGLGAFIAALGVFAAGAIANNGNGNGDGYVPVTICHATPTGAGNSGPANKYELITPDNQGVFEGHLGHPNDIIPASKEGCPTPAGDTEVTATAPTFIDPTCDVGAGIVIPEVTSVQYKVKGTVAPGETVEVNAKALPGYELVGTKEWKHTYGRLPENCASPVEVTPTAPTFQDPTCDVGAAVNFPTVKGVIYAVKGTVAPGETVNVKATADEGYVLVGTDKWEHTFGQVPSNCTPPPPHEVKGDASVACILPDGFYRVSGAVDGQAADEVVPATIPGAFAGSTEVTVTRGDTSFRGTVTTDGKCGNGPTPPVVTPPAVVTPPPVVAPPAVTTPTTVPTAPFMPPKASTKPAAPVKVKKATTTPTKPTVKVAGAAASNPPTLAYTP